MSRSNLCPDEQYLNSGKRRLRSFSRMIDPYDNGEWALALRHLSPITEIIKGVKMSNLLKNMM